MSARASLPRSATLLTVATLAGAAVLGAEAPARACGGFFCSRTPIVQSGERIVYGLEADGTLTMIVEIEYAGDDADFAWILPVPAPPISIELGSTALLDLLDGATSPRIAVTDVVEEGTCLGTCGCAGCLFPTAGLEVALADAGPPPDARSAEPTLFQAEDGEFSSVDVILDRPIGPFEVVVLGGASGTAVAEWLVAHGYVVPAGALPILDQYAAAGQGFVALRMRGDVRTRRIRPIVLRMPTPEVCLPLRLTAVAATPRLPITAFFLAPGPVVPRNVSFVEVPLTDPALYLRGGTRTWNDAANAAIAEHGGVAFAAAYVGATPRVALRVPYAAGLSRETDVATFIRRLATELGYTGDADLFAVLRDHLWTPSSDPLMHQAYFNCLATRSTSECGGPESQDLAPLAAAIDEEITRPRAYAADLLERHANLTRLYTSLRPEDMNVDPIFVLDDGFPATSNVLGATAVIECSGPSVLRAEAGVRLEVDGNVVMRIPAPSCRGTGSGTPARTAPLSGRRHCGCRAGRPEPPGELISALGLAVAVALETRRGRRRTDARAPRSP